MMNRTPDPVATQCRYCTPWPNHSNSELCILSKSWGFAPTSAASRTRGMFVCWRNDARITQRGAWEMSAVYSRPSLLWSGLVMTILGRSVTILSHLCAQQSSLCPGSRVITSWNLWQVILCPLRCKIRKARNTSIVYLTYVGPHPVSQALSQHLIWLGEIYSISF